MTNIYLLIPTNIYIYIREYLDVFIDNYKFQYIMYEASHGEEYNIETNENYSKDNIYVYVSCRIFSLTITNKDNNIGLLNTESYDRHVNQYGVKSIINIAAQNKISFLLEYSEENCKHLRLHDEFNNTIVYFCPATVLNKEIFNYHKTDIIGSLNCNVNFPRRHFIMEQLRNKHINVCNNNQFGQDRDSNIMKFKIFLNIHSYDEFDILEQTKINRLVYNKIIVISETGKHIEDTYIKKFIIYCDYNQLVNTVIKVSNNYDFYYNQIFNEFNLSEITHYYDNYYQAMVKDLLIT